LIDNLEKDIASDDMFFSPDFEFIELINKKETNSPWKAKAHDFMKGISHDSMKKMLGIQKF